MFVWRPTDGDGVKLLVEPHLRLLAQDWEPRSTGGQAVRKRAAPLHGRQRLHRPHLPLHAAHG